MSDGDKKEKSITEIILPNGATILGLGTVALYYFGATYVAAFCEGLGLDARLLNFAPIDYLTLPLRQTAAVLLLAVAIGMYFILFPLVGLQVVCWGWNAKRLVKKCFGKGGVNAISRTKEAKPPRLDTRPEGLKQLEEELKRRFAAIEGNGATKLTFGIVIVFVLGTGLYDKAGHNDGRAQLKKAVTAEVVYKNDRSEKVVYVARLGDKCFFHDEDGTHFQLVDVASIDRFVSLGSKPKAGPSVEVPK